MNALAEVEQGIDELLSRPPYGCEPRQHHDAVLEALKQELAYACDRNSKFRNYVEHWPVPFRSAQQISDLPYLAVRVFKANPPLSLVHGSEVKRTLMSSATTGQEPSRVVLDSPTARRMTKGVITIIRDFIGSARRPYLVVDTLESTKSQTEMGARSAAIQALGSFATETVCCLEHGPDAKATLNVEKLLACADRWSHADVLVYGFTYVIWTELVQPLKRLGITLDLPNVRVLHSGGWKRLQERAVTHNVFNQGVADVFGCSIERVLDYYGMVENVGVVYPDCEYGSKHVPAFADVIVRDPLTLRPVAEGQRGLIQVCSTLPTSFPGFLLLTEDLAEVIGHDGCPCGRRGTSFRFVGRAPKTEVRGCGNLESTRHRLQMVQA